MKKSLVAQFCTQYNKKWVFFIASNESIWNIAKKKKKRKRKRKLKNITFQNAEGLKSFPLWYYIPFMYTLMRSTKGVLYASVRTYTAQGRNERRRKDSSGPVRKVRYISVFFPVFTTTTFQTQWVPLTSLVIL